MVRKGSPGHLFRHTRYGSISTHLRREIHPEPCGPSHLGFSPPEILISRLACPIPTGGFPPSTSFLFVHFSTNTSGKTLSSLFVHSTPSLPKPNPSWHRAWVQSMLGDCFGRQGFDETQRNLVGNASTPAGTFDFRVGSLQSQWTDLAEQTVRSNRETPV